jgi:hypothetical protein
VVDMGHDGKVPDKSGIHVRQSSWVARKVRPQMRRFE